MMAMSLISAPPWEQTTESDRYFRAGTYCEITVYDCLLEMVFMNKYRYNMNYNPALAQISLNYSATLIREMLGVRVYRMYILSSLLLIVLPPRCFNIVVLLLKKGINPFNHKLV